MKGIKSFFINWWAGSQKTDKSFTVQLKASVVVEITLSSETVLRGSFPGFAFPILNREITG